MTRARSPSLVRATAAAFAVYAGGAGMSYAAQLAVARTVGPAGYGLYAYVLAWVTVLAYLCALGFDVSLLRFVPAYRVRHAWGLMRGVIRYADRMVAALGIAVGLGGGIVMLSASGVPRELARTFLSGFALVPVLALLWVRCSTARAFGGVISALAPDRLVRDGTLVCGLLIAGPLLGWRIGAAQAMDITLAAGGVGLLLASLTRRRLSPQEIASVPAERHARAWMRAAAPLVVLGAAEAAMNRTGVVLLGWSGAVTQAGIYAVAFNVASLAVLPRTAVNALYAPAIADLFARGDHAGLQDLMARTAWWTLCGSIAIALPLLLLTGPILSWFGHDFAAGATVTRILLLGQLAVAGAGSQVFVLTMTGREHAAAAMLSAGTIGNALLGIVLIRLCGLDGAGIAASATLIGWNVVMAAFHPAQPRPSPRRARDRRATCRLARSPRMKFRLLAAWAGLLLAIPAACAGAAADRASARLLATPAMPQPAYLETVRDPSSGTAFTRITDPSGPPVSQLTCQAAYCTHRYSSAQAWNADQSLLVIVNGCAGFCFLDGRTFQPLFTRASPDECEWQPSDPTAMICMRANRIYRWNPRADTATTIYAATGYRRLQFGPYKGNLSADGRKLAVRAIDSNGNLVAFAYDIVAHRKYPDIRLDKLVGSNGYCSISPSGRFVFCDQTMPDRTDQEYVFTAMGVQLQHWTENHRPGHGDMTIDRDGEDVYIGISKADPDRYHVIKRRLRDGAVTELMGYGEAQHVSCRNTRLPGWAFVTYAGTYEEIAAHPDWAPFYQEVIALRTDGSGEIRRIAQTRQAKSGYWSETHGSPSPDGTLVVWSSNWGQPGAPVADYVTRSGRLWPGYAVPRALAASR